MTDIQRDPDDPAREVLAPPSDPHRDFRMAVLTACAPLQWTTDGSDASAVNQVREIVRQWQEDRARVARVHELLNAYAGSGLLSASRVAEAVR